MFEPSASFVGKGMDTGISKESKCIILSDSAARPDMSAQEFISKKDAERIAKNIQRIEESKRVPLKDPAPEVYQPGPFMPVQTAPPTRDQTLANEAFRDDYLYWSA